MPVAQSPDDRQRNGRAGYSVRDCRASRDAKLRRRMGGRRRVRCGAAEVRDGQNEVLIVAVAVDVVEVWRVLVQHSDDDDDDDAAKAADEGDWGVTRVASAAAVSRPRRSYLHDADRVRDEYGDSLHRRLLHHEDESLCCCCYCRVHRCDCYTGYTY